MLKGPWIRALAEGWERRILRRFDRVSTISGAMRQRTIQKGVEPGRAVLLPNWVDLEAIRPQGEQQRASNPYRRELGVGAQACVLLYSGSMNKKQGLELLVQAMDQLEDLPDLVWLLAGEGPSKAELVAATKGRANVQLLPLQPTENLNHWLNLADVHLLPQRAGAADLVLPSKLLGILASGRPVVAASPAASELGQLAEGAGLRVDPEDATAFAAAVRRLALNPPWRRELGRAARLMAEQQFGREAVLKHLEHELQT
jgi:colanic acid biosynthesis glycosyl transferase WcaI